MSELVAVARDLAARAAPRAAEHDRDASFPATDLDELRAAGFLGLLVPPRLGGLGASFEQYVQVAMALAAGNPASALVLNMHASVTGALSTVPDDLVRAMGAGDDFFAHRDQVLAAAAAGALYGVAISEAGVGSRLSLLTTTYRRTGDGFHLTGRKSACTAAGHADAYLVAARAHPDGPDGRTTGPAAAEPQDAGDVAPDVGVAPSHGGDGAAVSYFLVPAGPGVDVVGGWDPVGMRATASRGLVLDATVAASALLGVEGVAVLLAYAMPQWLVASYAAVYAGVALAAVDEATAELGRRHGSAGVPSAARARLGRADAAAAAAALAVEHAARLADAAPADPATNRWLYRAKLLAGDTAMDVTASLAEACGLGSLARGAPLERLYRDARLGSIMPPRSDVCADVLGAEALGLDPRRALADPPW